MPDEYDRAQEREAHIEEMTITASQLKARTMPKGYPGECDYCEEQSPRLVGGACARCRDKYKLP